MALFIGQLAFASADLLGAAKLGILAASGLASVFGLLAGRVLLREPGADAHYARSAAEAECSTVD
jgi:NhaA family Na+:H+ antiporter